MASWVLRAALWGGAYLLGSVPGGLVITRATRGVDVRGHGSGNIGTANVYRVAGRGPAIATFLFDGLKGALPVLLARRLRVPVGSMLITGAAPILGHNWSIFLKGRGGKGIATSIGVVASIAPPVAIVAGLVWGAVIATTRYASLASLAMMAAVPVGLRLRGYDRRYTLFGLGLLALAILRHRANIGRLLDGTELKLSGGSSRRGE